MSEYVHGIDLAETKMIIGAALETYAERARGSVRFDIDTASELALTPDKPNSARSQSAVIHRGKNIGDLYVIAFAPEDGTGDEKTFTLDDVNTHNYPLHSKIVPRAKPQRLAHTEAHLTIASKSLNRPDADWIPFAGNLELLSLSKNGSPNPKVRKIGELGLLAPDYQLVMAGATPPEPTVTLTTGYRYDANQGEEVRFGDPHSVYNPHHALQLCGFIALGEAVIPRHHTMFDALKARIPVLI